MIAERDGAVLVLVDMQPSFLKPIDGGEKVLLRCRFLTEIAALLDIPILATEQYPARMGSTDERLLPLLEAAKCVPIPKMTFSCTGSKEFLMLLEAHRPAQVVIAGIETHICINQTAQSLLAQGRHVFVAGDAVGARSMQMHDLGLTRLRKSGAEVAHSEAIAYEWLQTADNPKFREALSIIKNSQ